VLFPFPLGWGRIWNGRGFAIFPVMLARPDHSKEFYLRVWEEVFVDEFQILGVRSVYTIRILSLLDDSNRCHLATKERANFAAASKETRRFWQMLFDTAAVAATTSFEFIAFQRRQLVPALLPLFLQRLQKRRRRPKSKLSCNDP
jgi:hypothetical protein